MTQNRLIGSDMGRGNNKKISKLLNEQERLKKEIKRLLETIEVLQNEKCEAEEYEKHPENQDRHHKANEVCEACGKGKMQEVRFNVRDKIYVFLVCDNCKYRVKVQ